MNPTYKRVKICSPAYIRGRSEEAKFKREVNFINRGQRQIEREYKTSERKTTATQRGIISLLGNDVYLDPGIKDATILYGQNIPGFCYRRNGDARRPCSLYEAKACRVIYKLDEKTGEVFDGKFANIVSDNPLMDEILSSPQILPILCDLRTTSLLRNNRQLLLQFAQVLNDKLKSTTTQPINIRDKVEADPMVALTRYRTILIQQLFVALKIHGEIPYDAPKLTNNTTSLKSSIELVLKNSCLDQQKTQPIPEAWKQALTVRLKKNEVGTDRHVLIPTSTIEDVMSKVEDSKISCKKSSDEKSSTALRVQTNHLLPKSPKCMLMTNKELDLQEKLEVKRREKLDSFIKNLIKEMSNVVNLGKIIRELRRKNPCRADCSTGILERLLKDDSVFTSLNEEYCSLLHEQGTLTTSEHHQCLEAHHYLNTIESKTDDLNDMSTFVTSKENIAPKESQSFNFDEVLKKVILTHQSIRPSTMSKRFKEIQAIAEKRTKGLHAKSRHRLDCLACKAKLRQVYEVNKERDEKYQKNNYLAKMMPTGNLTKDVEILSSQITPSQPSVEVSVADGKNASRSAYAVTQASLKETSIAMSPMWSSKIPTLSTLKKMTTGDHESRRSVRHSKLRHVKFLPNLSTVLNSSPLTATATATATAAAPFRSSLPGSRVKEEGLVESWSKSKGSVTGSGRRKQKPTSWTLKVSRLDLLKLRHELERAHRSRNE